MRYVTPTRSGNTDASGTFKYLAGENVDFSLGSIQLGSVPGAPSITLFTLAGLSAPDTELALRSELDLSRRVATPFTRAVNMQRLFITLDADHDPANGYDVNAAATAIGTATIQFNLSIPAFAAKLDRLAPNMTQNFPLSRAVTLLYRGVNLVVQVHAETRSQASYPLDPNYVSPPRVTRYTPDGALLSVGPDYDGDGNADNPTIYAYDGLGRVTSRSGLNFSYNSTGALLDRFSSDTINGVLYVSHAARVPDSHGFALSEARYYERGPEAARTDTQSSTWGYDERHNLTSYEQRTPESGVSRQDSARYDSNDRLLNSSRTDIFHPRTEGVDTTRKTATYVYDDATRTTVADGTGYHSLLDYTGFTSSEWKYRITTVFDAAGNEISNTDEVIDSVGRTLTTSTFDSQSRLLTREFRQRYPQYETIVLTTNTYDAVGNLLTFTTDEDTDHDGTLDRRTVQTFEYGTNGEPVSSNTGLVYAITNEVIASGVLNLAQKYFAELDSL